MEDKQTISTEGETLNQEEKTTYTADEVKKMQSDSEKWVQKLIWQNKIFERVLDEVWKVAENKDHLVDLYDESPEVASIILDKYYDWKSIDDFKSSIGYKEDYTNPKMLEKLAEKKARALLEADKIAQAKTDFIKKFDITGEELKNFEEAFSERTELRSFRSAEVVKHLEKAFTEISDDPQTLINIKNQKAIAENMAIWTWKSWSWNISKKMSQRESIQSEVSWFLKKYSAK